MIIYLLQKNEQADFIMGKLNIKNIIVLVVILAFVGFFAISSGNRENNITDNSTQNANQQTESKREDFNKLSRERFDTVLANALELKEIECIDGDCTSVVYFHFNELPGDLDFMIKGNAKTFSNFKYEHTNTSHVTIFATHNGYVVYQCNANKSGPPECK